MRTTTASSPLVTGWAPTTVASEYRRCSSLCATLRDPSARYLILDILGQGTCGQVVKCQNMKTYEIVAVKVVKNEPGYFGQGIAEAWILELVNTPTDLLAKPAQFFILSNPLSS